MMRAAVLHDRRLVVKDVSVPTPGPGEVLVQTLACGICGSDLHAVDHADQLAQLIPMDPARELVMGHEFCAEVVDFGPGTRRRFAPGTRVCSMPILVRPGDVKSIGFSNDVPGGYAANMILSERLLLPVPGDLPAELAALTEPMAVGRHAVARAGVKQDEVPLVIGCGPIGLAVVAALRAAAVRPIIAADFSSTRRRLAERMGADVVIDPAASSPYASWAEVASRGPDGELLAMDPITGEKSHRSGVYFECVGVPGVLDQLMAGAVRGTRIVVVGTCLEPDRIRPLLGVKNELTIQFVLAYTGAEFALTLRSIANGETDVAPLVTGVIGLDELPHAFNELSIPDRHAKIIVAHRRTPTEVLAPV